MKKEVLLQAFAYALAAFVIRELYLVYRVYKQVTHQAPSTLEIIVQNGYPAEEHKVRTDDGYFLTIFRIPDGKSGLPNTGPKPVVLLQHGILSSSSAFVSIGPKSLAFLLADRGYDVWLGNIRGNKYGMEHTTYNTSDPKFWDFSADELVLRDIPAMVDYIFKCVNNKKLSYVGHSLGATVILGLLSKSPEYNDKIATVIAMAPGFPGKEIRSIAAILTIRIYIPWIVKTGHAAAIPYVNEVIDYTHAYCAPQLFFSFICDLVYSFGGPTTHVNRANLPLITASVSTTSRKLMVHLARTVEKGSFHHWNSDSGEDYPLHLVSAPVALFYSDSDYIINPSNVQSMNKSLPNVVKMIKVPEDSFNHLDFLFGETAEELVYKEMFKILAKYHKFGYL